MLDRVGFARRAASSRGELDARGRRRRLRARPDPRRRPGGAAARRDRCRCRAAASARRRPAPAASRRRCAPCPVVLEIAERVRELAGPRRLDRRLHEPGRDRHARAARRRPPRGRALQRRDRLPAAVRGAARRRAGARRRRPGRPQPPDLGARACGSTARTCSPALLAEHGDELADEVAAAAPAARRARRGARRYYLRYFYAHDAVLAEQLDGVPARGRRSPRSSASCSSSTATRR